MSSISDPASSHFLESPLVEVLARHLENSAIQREQIYRQQLERTIAVLEKTRQSFRSKQIKKLREEIELVLKTT